MRTPPDGSQKWAYFTGGGGGTSAISLDGTIYYNGYGSLYAITPSGKLKWKTMNGGDSMEWSSPAIGLDGTIYVTSWEWGYLRAYNPDGSLKWSADNVVHLSLFLSLVSLFADSKYPLNVSTPPK